MRTLITIISITAAVTAQEKYPLLELRGQQLQLAVMIPDAGKGFYRGSRFDWSGVIKDVKFNGHTLFGPWKDTHNPQNQDDITGPSEEFRTPLGYDDAKEGGTFLKIGVGSLIKPKEEKYRFGHNYTIKYPGRWEIEQGAAEITFKQGLLTDEGYGYKYSKTIQLLDNFAGFTLSHTLENVGSKPINTEWYNHNFYNINKEPIGVNFAISFPFNPKAKNAREEFAKYVTLNGPNLALAATIDPGSIFAEIEGFDNTADHHAFAVHHTGSRISMLVRGSEPMSKLNIWGVKTTICPEPYIAIALKPGESKSWSVVYKFSNGRRNGFNW